MNIVPSIIDLLFLLTHKNNRFGAVKGVQHAILIFKEIAILF